jgi:hypothetical protein
MGAANTYLLLYNVAQSVGWAAALVQTVLAIARDGSFSNVYAAAGATVSEPQPARCRVHGSEFRRTPCRRPCC